MSLVRFDRASYPEELVTIERRLQQACAHLLVWDARSSLAARGKPKTIRLDNGPEFAGRLLDQLAYLNGVELGVSAWAGDQHLGAAGITSRNPHDVDITNAGARLGFKF